MDLVETIHLFLRTVDSHLFTLVLYGVKRFNASNVRQGNIIFALVFLNIHQLTVAHIGELYEETRDQQLEKLLVSAQQAGLQALEISSSYGAECIALFQQAEFHPNHFLEYSPHVTSA